MAINYPTYCHVSLCFFLYLVLTLKQNKLDHFFSGNPDKYVSKIEIKKMAPAFIQCQGLLSGLLRQRL